MLQLARVPVLIALLGLAAAHIRAKYDAQASFELAELRGWWVVTMLINVAFLAAVLVGRRARHAWAALAVEAVAAGTLAVVLPWQWTTWFGFGRWTDALGDGLLQTLALAWLGVVVATGINQARDGLTARRQAQAPGATATT